MRSGSERQKRTDEEEDAQTQAMEARRDAADPGGLLVRDLVRVGEALLVAESVCRANGRNDFLGERRTLGRRLELDLLVFRHERIHNGASDGDERNNNRNDKRHPPIPHDGDDKAGLRGGGSRCGSKGSACESTHDEDCEELDRDDNLVGDSLLDQVRVGLNAGRDGAGPDAVVEGDVLAQNGLQVLLADTTRRALARRDPGVHVDPGGDDSRRRE